MMELPIRKPNRLQGYDYSQNGAYFVTICAKDRHELFGAVVVGADIIRPQLSDIGMIVENAISKISQIYHTVVIDCYVIMPNHIHIIIVITNNDDGRMISAPTTTLSNIIGYFKQNVSRTIGFSPWQKSFHDHIIRNEKEYQKIAEYIENNPINWKDDCFYGI